MKLIASLLFLMSFSALAQPVCLTLGTCMEYNGEIIDIRSTSQRAVDEVMGCDVSIGLCKGTFSQTQITPKLTPQDFIGLTKDSAEKKYFIPLKITDSDTQLLLSGLSLGTIVFAADREIMDFVQKNKTTKTQQVANIANLFGREAIFPIVAGAYFVGAVMDNGKFKQVGLFAVSTGLATQLVTEIFKKSFLRTRPNKADSPYEFGDSGFSFFSGHTSAAFSLATVIAEVYKDQPLVPYLSYGVAALTAYARMHDNKHWASDVLAGAIAGHLVTKIMMRTWENRTSTGRLTVTPMMGSSYGLRITYSPNRPSTPPLRCGELNLEGRALIEECVAEMFQNIQ